MNLLLRTTLFGCDDRKMHRKEVVHKTKNVTVIHIASYDRMLELVNLAGLCGVQFFYTSGHTMGCSGKVNCCKNGRHIVGYIVAEHDNRWTVHLVDNTMVNISRVWYNKQQGIYRYPANVSKRRYVITQFWPVRFLLRHTGECRFTLNRFTFDSNANIVPQFSS